MNKKTQKIIIVALALAILCLIPTLQNLAVVSTDGFESLNGWTTGGTPTLVTNPVYEGTYSVYLNGGGDSLVKDFGSYDLTQFTIHFAVRRTVDTAYDYVRFTQFYTTDWSGGWLIQTFGNAWRLTVNDGGAANDYDSSAVPVNNAQWYQIDLVVDLSADTTKFYVNSVLLQNLNVPVSGNKLGSVEFESYSWESTQPEIYLDSFSLSDTAPSPTPSTTPTPTPSTTPSPTPSTSPSTSPTPTPYGQTPDPNATPTPEPTLEPGTTPSPTPSTTDTISLPLIGEINFTTVIIVAGCAAAFTVIVVATRKRKKGR